MTSSHRPVSADSDSRYITDPTLLRELEGYSYVVLRPVEGILEKFLEIKTRLQSVTVMGRYVDTPHITLLQVSPGHDIDILKQVVAQWAASRIPFELIARNAAATLFGLPLATVGVEKSALLIDALETLRNIADSVSLQYTRDISADDWVFHMTLLDYAGVSPDAACMVTSLLSEYDEFLSVCKVTRADLVSYRDGNEELAGVFEFARTYLKTIEEVRSAS